MVFSGMQDKRINVRIDKDLYDKLYDKVSLYDKNHKICMTISKYVRALIKKDVGQLQESVRQIESNKVGNIFK